MRSTKKERAMKMLTFHIPFTLHSIVIATTYNDLKVFKWKQRSAIQQKYSYRRIFNIHNFKKKTFNKFIDVHNIQDTHPQKKRKIYSFFLCPQKPLRIARSSELQYKWAYSIHYIAHYLNHIKYRK
ncbi:hypothetical protein ACKWTF_010348 [Chironomus riparius]